VFNYRNANEWQRVPKYVDVVYDMDFRSLIQQDLGKFSFLINPIIEPPLREQAHCIMPVITRKYYSCPARRWIVIRG
jgi:hypothetical protein